MELLVLFAHPYSRPLGALVRSAPIRGRPAHPVSGSRGDAPQKSKIFAENFRYCENFIVFYGAKILAAADLRLATRFCSFLRLSWKNPQTDFCADCAKILTMKNIGTSGSFLMVLSKSCIRNFCAIFAYAAKIVKTGMFADFCKNFYKKAANLQPVLQVFPQKLQHVAIFASDLKILPGAKVQILSFCSKRA